MALTPPLLRYARTHEWVEVEDDGTLRIGITDHAQQALGDVVFVDLPQPGRRVTRGDLCVTIESVKAAGEVYAPVDGEILAVQADLADAPERVNEDPYAAWLFRLRPGNPAQLDELLSAAEYDALVGDAP